MGGRVYSMDTLDKGMIPIQGGTKQDGKSIYATQNAAQFNIYELFIIGNFYLIFMDHH